MELDEQDPNPEGELILRVIAHPRFTNALGDIYAGWLLDQMDQAAAQIAMKASGGRCATVSLDNVDFIAPVPVGSVSREVWRTNWPEAVPEDTGFDLGTLPD
mgnify:CR=1 FL=1